MKQTAATELVESLVFSYQLIGLIIYVTLTTRLGLWTRKHVWSAPKVPFTRLLKENQFGRLFFFHVASPAVTPGLSAEGN